LFEKAADTRLSVMFEDWSTTRASTGTRRGPNKLSLLSPLSSLLLTYVHSAALTVLHGGGVQGVLDENFLSPAPVGFMYQYVCTA